MAPFSSKYDDYVRGTRALTRQEARGLALFKDSAKGGCSACHKLDDRRAIPERSLFTDYGFDAVGVPRNRALPGDARPGATSTSASASAPARTTTEQDERVLRPLPRRRRCATSPCAPRFMHNGAFSSLRDVVAFYATRATNPERWYGARPRRSTTCPAKYRDNVNVDKAPYNRHRGRRAAARRRATSTRIVAFLGTLTDAALPLTHALRLVRAIDTQTSADRRQEAIRTMRMRTSHCGYSQCPSASSRRRVARPSDADARGDAAVPARESSGVGSSTRRRRRSGGERRQHPLADQARRRHRRREPLVRSRLRHLQAEGRPANRQPPRQGDRQRGRDRRARTSRCAIQKSAVDSAPSTYELSPAAQTPYAVLPPVLAGGAEDAVRLLARRGAGGRERRAPGRLRAAPSHRRARASRAARPTRASRRTRSTVPPGPVPALAGHRLRRLLREPGSPLLPDVAAARLQRRARDRARTPRAAVADLFPWVETTIGAGSNGDAQPPRLHRRDHPAKARRRWASTTSLQGDVPYFKSLADTYAMSDNFHQSIQGGTGRQPHRARHRRRRLVQRRQGQRHRAARARHREPRPAGRARTTGTRRTATRAAPTATAPTRRSPASSEVIGYLQQLGVKPNCEKGHYYLLNNYNPGYFGDGTVDTVDEFTIPPSSTPHHRRRAPRRTTSRGATTANTGTPTSPTPRATSRATSTATSATRSSTPRRS